MDFDQHLTDYIDQISRGQGPEADDCNFLPHEIPLSETLFTIDRIAGEIDELMTATDGLLIRTDRQIEVRDRVEAQLAEQSR